MYPFARSAAAFVLLAACQPATPQAPDFSAASAGAAALVEDWAATGTEGRWEDLPALFADEPGFGWVEQGELRYADWTAMEAGIEQVMLSGLTARTSVTNIEATPLAVDAVAIRAYVAITFGDPAADGFAFDGVLTAVAVERDGEWLFLQGHLSQPQSQLQPGAVRQHACKRVQLAPSPAPKIAPPSASNSSPAAARAGNKPHQLPNARSTH